jgi:hypothetical protein
MPWTSSPFNWWNHLTLGAGQSAQSARTDVGRRTVSELYYQDSQVFVVQACEGEGRNSTGGRTHDSRNSATVTLSSELISNGIFSTLTAGGQSALQFANMLAHEPQLGPFWSPRRRDGTRPLDLSKDFYQACLVRGMKPHLAASHAGTQDRSHHFGRVEERVRFDAEHLKQQAAESVLRVPGTDRGKKCRMK